jgi:hypothetical protein
MGKRMVKPPIIGYDHCTPISPLAVQFHRKTQVYNQNLVYASGDSNCKIFGLQSNIPKNEEMD